MQKTRSGGGMGVVWGWCGGGLTWVAQGSYIRRLMKLAMWLGVPLSAPCRDGGGTVWAWRVPDVCVREPAA